MFNVSELILDQSSDFAFLRETWLRTHNTAVVKELCPAGYNITHCPRNNRHWGGFAILHRKSFNLWKVTLSATTDTFEHMVYTINRPVQLNMAAIYRPLKQILAIDDPFLHQFELFWMNCLPYVASY